MPPKSASVSSGESSSRTGWTSLRVCSPIRCSEELPITNRRAVAGRQRGLLVGELVDDTVKTVERATMSREHASDGLVSPASDFGDLLGRRFGQRVKVKLTLAVTDVDAVEDEAMVVYVEAKRGVGALDERHGAELRVLDRVELARLLRPASK